MNVESTSQVAEKFEYKADMKRLLKLIVHSLYTNPEIFLRELVSNASDALNKIRFKSLTDSNIQDKNAELNISIKLDKDSNVFIIEDSGIGMTKAELINNLGSVAKSGTFDFMQNITNEQGQIDSNLIGQFGVGFYSVFMVADEVKVESKSYLPNEPAAKWVSKGDESFEISDSDKTTRGTRISFKLKEEYKEFAEDWKVKSILKKYSNFVDYPIYVGEEKTNAIAALWQKKKDELQQEEVEEFYKFVANDFQSPLDWLHLNIEGNVEFKALLFVPQTAPPALFSPEYQKALHLYVNKVFIQEDAKELLPEYLKFVRGVVECNDIPLNVSREITQSSPLISKIRSILTGKILGLFEDWAENDKEKFRKFSLEFGAMFKTGISSDFSNKDRILELIRYESTHTKNDEFTSLAEYVERMKEKQTEIYYLSGNSKESLDRNPNLEYFRKNDIEVLLLSDPIDVFVTPNIFEYKGKQLKSIEKADLNFIEEKPENESEENTSDDSKTKLIETIKSVLENRVEDVKESKRLVKSPVTLVVGSQGLDTQFEKMMQAMDKNYTSSKKILEVNVSHPILQNLAIILEQDPESQIARNIIEQLYDSALLMEGYLRTPNDFIERMYGFMYDATSNLK